MGSIRYCFAIALLVFFTNEATAQTVYYPANASELLRATAADMAMLLQKATSGTSFTTQSYTVKPAQGIVLQYDSSISDNQACKVRSTGQGKITFEAAEDNGLNFGVYQYLQSLGFRFYQPGSIWEITPSLSSPYKNIDTLYTCRFRYKNWFISGGHNRWIMDNSNEYPWDTYGGDNGHQWALYQRRNNMTGGYRFAGHRDDIMSEAYLNTLQNNPCFVAVYNGSRTATRQSVPDINNTAAMQFWGTSIEQKYTQYKNIIYANRGIYANYFHNFNYNNGYIGLEVPDGAHWANSKDNAGCSGADYLKESDQHFLLANFTAAKINSIFPDKRFQLYAYDGHADIPSPGIAIQPKIDIQVIPTAFQSETSAKGLLNRWYRRSANISEYHYLNLPQWSGETPSFFLDELKQTIERIKENNGQGMVIEASPAKFASLPFLLAANASLKDGTPVDNTLKEFCNTLFGHGASAAYQLLQAWSNDKSLTVNNGIQDNKYKLSLYYQLLKDAADAVSGDPLIVKQRVSELKAYLHYMALFYDWAFDQRAYTLKADKAAALCLYLAKVNQLKIVNSFFLITDIVNHYPATDVIYTSYNTSDGTAYQNGLLPLITNAEIEQNFSADLVLYGNIVKQNNFEDAFQIKTFFEENNLAPLEKIDVKISYTSGKDYPNRSEFYFIAPQAGSFGIQYTPRFDMPGKGNINFTVEAAEKAMSIIKDFSINSHDGPGAFTVSIPAAGMYKLTVLSKYKSAVALELTARGNYFYKNGPYIGNTTENYTENLSDLPGYFYIPAGVSRVYFSLNNSNPGGTGFASPTEVNRMFAFKDEHNNAVEAKLATASDSALFYLDVPVNTGGKFWKISNMANVRLTFANISNLQWYASKKTCSPVDFTTDIIKQYGECSIQLKTATSHNILEWKVYDAGKWTYYPNQQSIDLPASTSPNALVTLTVNSDCFVTKRIGDDPQLLQQFQQCATASVPITGAVSVLIYPNPGRGVFKCQQNGTVINAELIKIYSAGGALVASFSKTAQFDISYLPAGVYFYTLVINSIPYRGKLLKL